MRSSGLALVVAVVAGGGYVSCGGEFHDGSTVAAVNAADGGKTSTGPVSDASVAAAGGSSSAATPDDLPSVPPSACNQAPAVNQGTSSLSPGEVIRLSVPNIWGLCYDGNDVYLVDQENFLILRHTWPELSPIASYAIPKNIGPSVLGDCAVLNGVLYYADIGKSTIGTIDLDSGVVDATHFASPATRPRSIAADGDTLWVSCDDALEVFRMSPDGTVLGSIPDSVTKNGCEGLEASPTGLWCTDTAMGAALKLSKSDGALLAGPFTVPYWEGLALIDCRLWAGTNGLVHTEYGLEGPIEGRTIGIAPLSPVYLAL